MRFLGRARIKDAPFWKALFLGGLAGAVLALFAVASYQTSGDARFCAACHSMGPVYHQWRVSNHKQFPCIECHLPDTHILGKLAYKTKAGLNDYVHEALRAYPAVMPISEEGLRIAEKNCLRCHTSTVENTPMAAEGGRCLKCHRYLIHGRGAEKGGIRIEG
jgi:cytochrome c nitrite reductase small subunit